MSNYSIQLLVLIPPELKEKLNRAKKETGLKSSEIVRRALVMYLKSDKDAAN
jgi:predicted DNA-binding protein